MEEDIKKLERFIKDYRICERNCKGFTSNVTSISREEYQSLENLIKGCRKLEEKLKDSVPKTLLREMVEKKEDVIDEIRDNFVITEGMVEEVKALEKEIELIEDILELEHEE